MKKLLSFVAAMIIAATAFAQVDEVTLTVIGTGQTEEQATLQALRSAIEQSFGTFVSANTTILNDEFVQDEIVSTTTGNVKEYKKLAVATLPNGQVSVSIKATVSVNKLISYAKSKGSRAEFAGSTYAANVKLAQLKASSAKKVYDLMVQQLENLAKDMFTFELKINGEPELCKNERLGDVYAFNYSIDIMSNIASTNFYNVYYNTIKELKLTKEEATLCANNKIEMIDITNPHRLFRTSLDASNACIIPISSKLYWEYQKRIGETIYSTLHRYTIQEIGNPSNSYSYVVCTESRGCYPTCLAIRERNREGEKGDYQLYSKKWQERIFSYGHNKRIFMRSFDETYGGAQESFNELMSKFAMKEVKTPVQLSKKEQKEVKKGTFKGATYTISYQDPKIIKTHEISVAIPTNKIDGFQGFEIKTK